MKPIEEMIRAVGDWVNGKIKALDPETLLRKTGDASKVRVKKISKTIYTQPTFTDDETDLDDILGTITAALRRISPNIYYDLCVYSYIVIDEIASSEIFEWYIDGGSFMHSKNEVMLIYGKGGAWTAANGKGTADFFRAYLVFWKDAPLAGYPEGWVLAQIGSVGSTARWTLTATLSSATTYQKLILKIPKGYWAKIGTAYLNL